MKFERIGTITMRDLAFEICWKVDNRDSFERTSADGQILVIVHCSQTYFFSQIPHPMHNCSERNAILSVGFTSMQSFPVTINQDHCACT